MMEWNGCLEDLLLFLSLGSFVKKKDPSEQICIVQSVLHSKQERYSTLQYCQDKKMSEIEEKKEGEKKMRWIYCLDLNKIQIYRCLMPMADYIEHNTITGETRKKTNDILFLRTI